MRERKFEWYGINERVPDLMPDKSKWNGENSIEVLIRFKDHFGNIGHSVGKFSVLKYHDEDHVRQRFTLDREPIINYEIIEWAFIC